MSKSLLNAVLTVEHLTRQLYVTLFAGAYDIFRKTLQMLFQFLLHAQLSMSIYNRQVNTLLRDKNLFVQVYTFPLLYPLP